MSDVSKSLRSLTKNEQMRESLVFLSDSLIRSFFCKITSDSLRKPMSKFPALIIGIFLLILWFRSTFWYYLGMIGKIKEYEAQ